MDAKSAAKTIRQLQRAEGYIELHLPERALSELSEIEDPGTFEPAIALLRGEALAVQERYTEAVDLLKRAASMIPAPFNKRAWRSLSQCYRHSGREELADMADLVVNSEAPAPEPQIVLRVAVVPLQSFSQAIERLLGRLAEGTDASGDKSGPSPAN